MKTQEAHDGESYRTRLVGFNDLQGRETLQVDLKGDWCYVGHLPGNRVNPLTGKAEDNGTSILDVLSQKIQSLLPISGSSGANCRAVQVWRSVTMEMIT